MADWGIALSAEWSAEKWTVDDKPMPFLHVFRGKETGDLHVKIAGLLLTFVARKGGFCRS